MGIFGFPGLFFRIPLIWGPEYSLVKIKRKKMETFARALVTCVWAFLCGIYNTEGTL